MTDENEKNHEGSKKKNIYRTDPTDITIGDFHITINRNIEKIDAISLLKQMYHIRNDSSLTMEQKTDKVQQLLKDIQI